MASLARLQLAYLHLELPLQWQSQQLFQFSDRLDGPIRVNACEARRARQTDDDKQ